ncbi:uncharacterized protein PAN0_046c6404 [Moesziomyces antarcticus]|uniref:Uncharacterized protein n=1 Tax=Pseudozyma antarctica TaxID=84753 RepID=A0A081CNC2_PSEA2|nr:uncharacterized protein PAN0_046c6404 [Moesziomyces antarcticus]GAK68168.1 hypothetical protein PAN0_046c6404 [Moesziomyces antarcticus]
MIAIKRSVRSDSSGISRPNIFSLLPGFDAAHAFHAAEPCGGRPRASRNRERKSSASSSNERAAAEHRFASASARAASDPVPHIAPRRCANEQQQQRIDHRPLGVTSNCAFSLLSRP